MTNHVILSHVILSHVILSLTQDLLRISPGSLRLGGIALSTNTSKENEKHRKVKPLRGFFSFAPRQFKRA